jgi:polysaccharide deacetylase family protein (PEP-CTERM system associated)
LTISPWSSSVFPSATSPDPADSLNPNAPPPRLPLTFDWEDWFQLCCPPFDGPDALDRFEDRLERGTDLALQLCDDLNARGTWFCLADQARRHPALLRRIQSCGHVIALHGLDHRRAFTLDPVAFQAWVEQGKETLESIAGAAIQGFRAPEWSLRLGAARYVDALASMGFVYDSSRAPLPLLGDPGWPRRPSLGAEGLWEFPPPVADLALWTVPLWGWGLRVLPEAWLLRRLRWLAASDAGTPLTIHPWELDETQPLLPGASLGHRFAHRAGLVGYGERLRRLLTGLALVPIEDWLSATAGIRAN